MIARALRVLQDKGMEEGALFVDAQNPNGALKLYESMGYRVHQRRSRIARDSIDSPLTTPDWFSQGVVSGKSESDQP